MTAGREILLVGQSLELRRPRFAQALRDRDPAVLLESARAQAAAGAHALDLNAGLEGTAADLAWTAAALREGGIALPLFLDTGSTGDLVGALRLLAEQQVPGPFIANALPVGGAGDPDAGALLDAVAAVGGGLVISPRLVGEEEDAGSTPEEMVEVAYEALEATWKAGVTGPRFMDALAWPPIFDAAACRGSLLLLRLFREAIPGVLPLVAVGNVSHGAPPAVADALRRVYAAAAAGAGAMAAILPVEDDGCRLAATLAPSTGYLLVVAQAVGAGQVPPPPEEDGPLLDAWGLIFGAPIGSPAG